uniref:Uncharacterized protein n=1 Tax=Arundo donax TaxID=35708 RepID=A0A0A9BLC2_ARUDO
MITFYIADQLILTKLLTYFSQSMVFFVLWDNRLSCSSTESNF